MKLIHISPHCQQTGRQACLSALALALFFVTSAVRAQQASESPQSGDPAVQFQALEKEFSESNYAAAAVGLQAFTRENAGWQRIAEATRLYGASLVLSGEISAGKQILDRIIEQAPDAPETAEAYFYRGKALEGLGDFPGAVIEYNIVWTKFQDHALAPQAALNEAELAERILNNSKRAQNVYEQFITVYGNHQAAPDIANHLALMAERSGEFEKAVELYRNYATANRNRLGYPALNGSVAGPLQAMWRAAVLAAEKLKNPHLAVELYQAYVGLPGADRAQALITAARIAAGTPDAGNAEQLYEQALQATPVDEWSLEFADWLKKQEQPQKANAQLLRVVQTTQDRNHLTAALNALGEEETWNYLNQNPTRFPVFQHYLNWFKAPEKRAAGRAALETWLDRKDIEWKTVIAKQWAEWTNELQDLQRIIETANSEGLLEQSVAATLAVADRLLPVETVLAGKPVLKIQNADGTVVGYIQAATMDQSIVIRATVSDRRATAQAASWPETGIELYFSMPKSTLIRQIMIKPKAPQGPVHLAFYENGEPVPPVPFDWAVFPHSDFGYDIIAAIPMAAVKIAPNAGQILFEAAACTNPQPQGETLFITLFDSGTKGAFGNNEFYGQLNLTSGLQASQPEKIYEPQTYQTPPTRHILEASLKQWAAYPDFPKAEFAARLRKIAELELLTTEKIVEKTIEQPAPPPAAEGEPQPAPPPPKIEKVKVTVTRDLGTAARRQALELTTRYQLTKAPLALSHAAALAVQLQTENALDMTLQAAEKLMGAGHLKQAAEHCTFALRNLPEHNPKRIELLFQIALAGNHNDWKEFYDKTAVPAAKKELDHCQAVNPATEQTRLATVKLAHFFDPKQSVARHDDYLKQHSGSPQAHIVRLRRFFELQRAGQSPANEVQTLIETLADNPALARSLPVSLVPAGPKGYDLAAKYLEAGISKADNALKPELLLILAKLHLQFGREAAAMTHVQELVKSYANTPQATEAQDLVIGLFNRGFFPPGLTQQDAQQAFQWLINRALAGDIDSFGQLTGNVWRLACHPAARLRNFENFSSLYLFSTHQNVIRAKDANEFLSALYGSYPADGTGPAANLSNGPSPYRGGDKFMLYRWGLLRAPVSGYYNFWFQSDDWTGVEIDGQPFNFPVGGGNGHFGVHLTRGLHIFRVAFGDWGGGHNMRVDWQPPGKARTLVGPEAFSANRYPLILSAAAAANGTFGTAEWDAYLKQFPKDSRAQSMRLETFCLANPGQAAGQLQQRAGQYPDNPRYKALLADCRWRLNQMDQALADFRSLAALPVTDTWVQSHNALTQKFFLQGQKPAIGIDEYLDRIRAASAWKQWRQNAAEKNGVSGELQACIDAADHLTALASQVHTFQQSSGRINALITKEQAQIDAAKTLAEKADAEDAVRREAQTAVASAQQRLAYLQVALKTAQTSAAAAEAELNRFRQSVGIPEGRPPLQLALQFAQSKLTQGSLDVSSVFNLSQRVWSTYEEKTTAKPFLIYVVARSTDHGQIAWATDRLVDLAMAGEDPGEALNILATVGMRAPKDPAHAEWLRRACDLALQAGDVYTFARNAHILAAMHPENKTFSSYLPRLGEVFEKAGNYVSAEAEYRRTIESGQDPAGVRDARLSLAKLYQKQDRDIDALKQLSALVHLNIPGDDIETRSPVKAGDGDDPLALLVAVRSYLALEMLEPALSTYDRAAASPAFGKDVVPDYALLVDLAEAAVKSERSLQPPAKDTETSVLTALPPAVLERAEKAVDLVDTTIRFHEKNMTPQQVVHVTLLRADAHMLMRNFPRAIEEIRAAKNAAGDSPAALMADLKMGELHLATDNADQALPIFRKLAAMDRRDVSPLALFWLGTTQLYLNDKTQAVEAFRILWERYAENELVRQAIYTIAKTYAEQGAFLDAIRLYEAVGAMNSLPREKVIPGDILTVKVWDADYFLGTGDNVLPVDIHVPSGDKEELGLEMNKINNSLFLGTIRTVLGDPVPGDGILQIVGTDMVYVTYQDRFKGLEEGQKITADALRGERRTSLIQVVENSDIKVSPQLFTERDSTAKKLFIQEKTEAEKEEERRLAALSASLERGEGVIRPGNMVYLRLQDGDHDRTGEPDTVQVTAFTYSVKQSDAEIKERDLAAEYRAPRPFAASDVIPNNPTFSQGRFQSPPPGQRPRLDTVNVTLTETGPHTGIFYGTVQTAVNGPTAIASDHAGDRVAAYAIDGSNTADDAWLGFIDGKPGKWLEIDMKELRQVARVVWDRGAGADDRYMIDYTLTLRGHGQPTVIEVTDNQVAHDNEIILETPVTCRWLRFTTSKFDGDAPAISQVQVFDPDGNQIIPPETSPLERALNAVLEFNVGDCMAAEVTDDENLSPGRPVKRLSNPLGVDFVNGKIDAIYLSYGQNTVQGSQLLKADPQNNFDAVFGRRTKRINPDDVLQVVISDPDLDIDSRLNTAECDVFSSSGDRATLTAEELRPTAAIFRARIQLSSNQTAMEDENRLWVRPRDVVIMRYTDKENRSPGHSVRRYAAVYVARDEVAYYPGENVAIATPSAQVEYLEAPRITATLVDPDLAIPGKDTVDMNMLSFATRDHVAVNLLLRNLDGIFSGNIPLRMDERPEPTQPLEENAVGTRRLITLNKRGTSSTAFTTPLAIAGDDILYMSYVDPTPKAAAARIFIPVASTQILADLQALTNTELPENAEATETPILLEDPLTRQKTHARQRQEAVLHDIARKKMHYRRLLETYNTAIENTGRQIAALTESTAAALDNAAQAPQAAAEQAPTPEQAAEGSDGAPTPGVEIFTASEELIRAAALRRDRDALTMAMKALRQRLDALEKSYDTKLIEEKITAREAELRAELDTAAAKQQPETAEPAAETPPQQQPEPWYMTDNWWTKCGGVLPGTTLVLHISDPDLTTDTVTVQVAAISEHAPKFVDVTAHRIAEGETVWEARIKTTAAPQPADNQTLSLLDARYIIAVYQDETQADFPAQRSSFLSLASNATTRITGADFLEAKTKHHLGEDIFLSITDDDMNKTAERDFVWVELTADTGDVERIAIRETQPQSGIFRGSVPTRLGEMIKNDGMLSAEFGGSFTVHYVDELWRDKDQPLPPRITLQGQFVDGTDGTVEIFARQLKRGALQRDVLFNTARAEYELGKSSTEMGAAERGRRHLLESRDKFSKLIALFPDDPVCAHATYYLGNIHFLLNDVEKAVISLQQVIDNWPNTEFKSKALYKLGTCYMRTGRMDKAIESFVNLAYHHPDSPLVADAMLTMAQQFSTKKHYDKAVGIGQAFIRKFPQHPKAGRMYLRLAGWLIANQQLAAAADVLDQAEKQMPDSELMPAFLYWHADCIFKTSSSRSNEYRRGIVMLQRIKYDYGDTKWAKYATARLTEVDMD